MRFVLLSLLSSLTLAACTQPSTNPQALPPAGLAGAPNAPAAAPAAPAAPSPHGNAAAPTDGMPPPPMAGIPTPHGTPMAPSMTPPGAGTEGNVTLAGTVLETMDVAEYTYVKLKLGTGVEEWAAINKVPVAVGDTLTVAQSIVMNDFHSSSLNRTFPRIIFGTLVGSPKKS
jgi:hypothetical protein